MIVSTDSHVIEPPDLWIDRLPRSLQERAPHLVADHDADWWYVDGLKLMSVHGGADVGVRFEDQAKLRMAARMSEVRRGAYEPDRKLADMDADGVDREVMYTTLGLQLWRLADTVLLQSLFGAYNEWIAAFCASAPQRLAGVALVLLDDIDAGIAELQRAARELGLRGAMISVYPDESIAYDHPRYEPFWAAAADLGIVLSLHIGTNRVLPSPPSSTSHAPSDMALKFLSTPARYVTSAHWVQLSLANMIFAGVFERHPTLKVVSLEHEIAWVPHFLQSMDYTYTQRARRSQWYRFRGDARPSDFFHRSVMISFQEDALGLRMRDVVGVDSLVWGSDYPHAESTFPHSRTILDRLFAEVPAAERIQILDTNAECAVLLMNDLVLSPNLEFLFADASADFNDRVAIAAAAGVRAFECWGWRDKDVDGLERVLHTNDVRVTAMVIDPIVSMVCDPEEFVTAIRETAEVGNRLRASTIIVATLAHDATVSEAEQWDRAVAALRDALPYATANGMALAIEPVNNIDHPMAYVSRLDHAMSIVDAVGSAALGIVVDFYHASRMNEVVADIIGDRVELIRHMQLAGLPHRNEPSAASAPYLDTVRAFRDGGYDGPIGLEYRPQLPSAASWDAVRRFLREQLEVSAR